METNNYRKANRLAWLSFALLVIPRVIIILIHSTDSGKRSLLEAALAAISYIGVVGMIYACVLALRAKSRSLTWLLLLVPLNLLGVVIIFMLADDQAVTG